MASITEKIRDGIFALHTRRFGKVPEIMIKKLLSYENARNQFHDLYDAKRKLRVEVKFSRALKALDEPITEDNIIESLLSISSNEAHMFNSNEWQKYKFDCNIQQVKGKEFDILYYGIFFADAIMIFKLTPPDLKKLKYASDKQHKGNVGEGQFHLNEKTYEFHLQNFFERKITYEELVELLQTKTTNEHIVIS